MEMKIKKRGNKKGYIIQKPCPCGKIVYKLWGIKKLCYGCYRKELRRIREIKLNELK